MHTDEREAFLSWADHCGMYCHSDVDAILPVFGRTWAQWINHCELQGLPNCLQAKPLLDWLEV